MDWTGVNSKQDDQRFSSIIEFQDHFEFTNEITHFKMLIASNQRPISSEINQTHQVWCR